MGLIHLYSATSTTFDNNGTPLVTAREAVVKRDEGFQLTFNIPISQNDLHKRVQKEMIVSAMTPDGVNYFRIWDIEKRTTDVKVTALQLLYSLDVKQINPFGGRQYTGNSVLQAFVNSFKSSISPYTFSSSITTSKDFYTNEKDDTSTSHNALAILNKITDNWSGELMLNGFDVRMISKLGTKTDALLYEHKNIASFSDSSSMNGIVTRIYATATYTPERAEGATEDPEPVVLTATVDSPLINQYAVIYEATMEYNDARTVAELRTEILKQYSEFNVDKPERTIDVDTNIVDGTAINFGDELVLKYLVHDVDEVIRCVGYEYDPISENYIGVTLGTLEKTFLTKVTEGISSTVTKQLDKLTKQIQIVQTSANGKNRVTYGPNPVPNAIEGDLWFKHPEGRPDEIELLIYQNGLWLPAPFLTDQDKSAFEQEVADYQNAVLAEVALKDQAYKEIFEGYDAKVLTIDQEIADAATKAQSALEEAGVSTDLAQTAKDLAATAQANANTAKTNASAAVTNANQAKADAQTAIDDANTALANASQAKTDSQTAMTNASKAKTDASQALTNASTAITNASQAKTDASKAVTDAQTALDNSSTAIANAEDAITKAGQAETTANTAKTNAQTALDDAQSALTTAGNAKTTADTLSVKVSDLEGEVELKASQTEVDGISGTVSTHATTLSQQATAISSKADKSVVDTLSGTVDNHTTEIAQNATGIATKASTSSVNTLTGRVDTAESNISQNATAITQRVTTTTYNSGIASKENTVLKQSTAPTHSNGRLWLDTSVTPNILKRSTGTEWVKATPTTASEVGAYSSSQGNTLAGRVTTAETNITQTATAITSKADKSTVDALAGTVSTQGTTITQQADLIESKANQSEVDTVKGTVSGHTTTLSQHATAIASKAEKSVVDTIKGTVDNHTTDISQNATDIATKASASSVNTLTGRVDTAESNITQNATAITQRVTTTTYNTGIASKENTVLKQSTAPTHLNGKLWLDTSVTPNILKRSNGTTWIKATPTTPGEVGAYSQSDGAGLAGRLTTAETNITQTATAITSKADKSTVDTLAGTVSTQGTKITQQADLIASKANQTEVDTVKGTVSGHTTTISQHATQIASKAEKNLVDTIKGTVDTHTTDIKQNATNIASKASSASVNTLTGRVSTAESNIGQNATAITQRVTTTTYNAGIATKEDNVLKQSTAPAHLNGRLWLDTSATPNILKRSTGNAWVKATPTTASEVGAYSSSQGSALAGRVTTAETNITQTSTAITSKADKSVVDTLSGTVSTHNTTISQHATAIASKASQTEVDTVKGTVSTHTSTLSQQAKEISARLTESQVNTLVGGKGYATQTWSNQTFATPQSVTTQLQSYAKTTALNGMVTETTLANKNFITASSVNTLLTSYAKTTALNGMVTETTLATKQFVTAGSMSTTLSSYAKTSNVPTNTQFNTLKNSYDSMVQTIGTNGSKIAQIVLTNSTYQTTVANLDIMARVGTGQQLNSDPLFEKGLNGIGVYNNSGGTHVTITRESASGDPTPTNNRLKIVTNGSKVSPGWGGIIRNTTGRVKAEFVIMFTALLPKGRSFQYAQNPLGTGFTHKWLTSPNGTGDWAEYAYYYKCGTGSVSTFGHLQVLGGATPTAAAPLTWYLAKHEVYDISGSFQTQVTQLADSWALTLKSGNDIKTQLNLTTGGVKIKGDLIHLSGTSQIDNAVIKSAMVDTLNVSKLTGTTAEFTTLRGKVITAGSISADRLVTGTALVDRVFVDTAAITRLTSKSAFITNIKAISIDVGKITGDKANFITLSFEALNSNMKLNAGAIRIQNSAGDFASMNTIPEFRSQDSAGTAAIMGKGRSHYYSGNQARFYIGSNLEGSAQYGIHIAKGQTFGIYRNSNTYGGTPAQYYNTPSGWGAVQIVEKLISLGYIPGPFATGAALIKSLNGWSSWPVLQPGDQVMYKAAVAGNSSGVETLWSMGTSSAGVTRLYSHPEHVFDYRIEVKDRARFIAKALFEASFTNNSDRRIKHDIKDTEVRALDHLDSLTFKEYKLNSNGSKVPLGLIAQDSGILRVKGEDEDDYEGVDGLLMPMLAMKGVQELHAIVKEQAERIKQLEEIINQ